MDQKENNSKVKELFYSKLKTREYFTTKNLSVNEVQTVFSYRARMATFKENCGHSPCPLCLSYLDSQPSASPAQRF